MNILPEAHHAEFTSTQTDFGQSAMLTEVVFAPIGNEGLPQQIVRRIAEGINIGLLSQGEKLPTAARLAESLQVSPMTLREALAILRQSGYIESVRGRNGGIFVRRGPDLPNEISALEALRGLTPAYISDLADHRLAINSETALLAANRATPEEAEHIYELAEGMVNVHSFRAYRRLDTAFHLAVASAAHSPRLLAEEKLLQIELTVIMESVLELMGGKPDTALRTSNREHLNLALAILEGESERAKQIAVAHVRGSLDIWSAMMAPLMKLTI